MTAGEEIGIVDIADDMRGIMAAAVIVGIVIIDIARTQRQVNARAASTPPDLDDMRPGVSSRLEE